jgi:hypothetical protein
VRDSANAEARRDVIENECKMRRAVDSFHGSDFALCFSYIHCSGPTQPDSFLWRMAMLQSPVALFSAAEIAHSTQEALPFVLSARSSKAVNPGKDSGKYQLNPGWLAVSKSRFRSPPQFELCAPSCAYQRLLLVSWSVRVAGLQELPFPCKESDSMSRSVHHDAYSKIT